ncbi:hypothetical protein ACQUJV_24915 [Ralstonia pseudosolanacearum]
MSEVVEPIERQLRLFVDAEQWSGSPPVIINQRAPESAVQAGDFPSWDLEPLTQLDMERGKPYRAGHVEKKNQQGIVGGA